MNPTRCEKWAVMGRKQSKRKVKVKETQDLGALDDGPRKKKTSAHRQKLRPARLLLLLAGC
jgi:hypothetical protein